MKTLELDQMEQINGGQCEDALEEFNFVVSGSSLIFAVAAVAAAATPLGWAMLALSAAAMAGSTASCMD